MGSARINRQMCQQMAGSQREKNRNAQLRYKNLLVKAKLLKPDWERTIRRRKGCATHHLTDDAMTMFQSESIQSRGVE